ncbi:MAG: hypothetical protein II707_10810, partial [Spirochaetales bacterium]|nr:hypothetical protein [Spirochaetales bacterium]
TTQSAKYPDGGAVQFPFDGKYPAVTVADNNRPLIIAYDETNRKLKAFYYNGTITNISSLTQSGDSNWKQYEIASGEGVGLYPRIECQLNSAGTAIEGGVHLFYQDAQTGALCYGYASSIANLGSTTKIVIDTDCAPGYYNDIRLNDSYIICTYIAYGNLGTGDAIRVARCSVSADTTDRSNWEIITLPSSHSIIENKVRGYFASTNKMVYFGMSSESGPELFREY